MNNYAAHLYAYKFNSNRQSIKTIITVQHNVLTFKILIILYCWQRLFQHSLCCKSWYSHRSAWHFSHWHSASEILLKCILRYLFLRYLLIVLCLFMITEKESLWFPSTTKLFSDLVLTLRGHPWRKDEKQWIHICFFFETALGIKPAEKFTPGLKKTV